MNKSETDEFGAALQVVSDIHAEWKLWPLSPSAVTEHATQIRHIAQALATARAQGHRAGMEKAAGIVDGIDANRGSVECSIHVASALDQASAAILAASETDK